MIVIYLLYMPILDSKIRSIYSNLLVRSYFGGPFGMLEVQQ